jgi:hypothetical protein
MVCGESGFPEQVSLLLPPAQDGFPGHLSCISAFVKWVAARITQLCHPSAFIAASEGPKTLAGLADLVLNAPWKNENIEALFSWLFITEQRKKSRTGSEQMPDFKCRSEI